MRFKPDGRIYVQGRLAETDREVVAAIRSFLSYGTAELNGKKWDIEPFPLGDLKFSSGSPGKNGDGGSVLIHTSSPPDLAKEQTRSWTKGIELAEELLKKIEEKTK